MSRGALAALVLAVLVYINRGVILSLTISTNAALANANVRAFLRAIRAGESSLTPDAYRMIVYGGYFSDMSTHPRIFKPIPGSTLKTSAAGAYQITYTTWIWLHVLAGVDDFSPDSQDRMAIAYLRKLGILADVMAGDFEAAAAVCRDASPLIPGDQPIWEAFTVPVLNERMRLAYVNSGGVIA